MNVVLKYKFEIATVAFLIGLYFLLRLPNLTLQPIFADEAIYIRWAQLMRAEPTLRFISLTDGKTPFFMWAMIPLFKIFHDPLFAGRFLSVLSGLVTFFGLLFLGWKFFNKLVAIIAAFLFVITPMFVFFDRMALVDSMLAACTIWSLNLSLTLIKYQRIDLAMLLGYVLGLSLLVKPPGFFNVLTLPTTLLALDWRSHQREKKILKMFGLFLISIIITLAIYSILKLGPGFDNLNSRNNDYVFSPGILLTRPLDPFIPHFWDLVDWLPKLLTLPILFLIIIGIVLSFIKKSKIGLAILFWSILPLLIQMVFLKTFTARYILFSFPPLLILAGWGLKEILEKIKDARTKIFLTLAVILLLSLQPLYFNFMLLTDSAKTPLPKEERKGYFEDWTAGYGLKEIAQFLIDEEQTKNHQIVVGTEGNFGTLPDGLAIYLDQYPQIIIKGGKGQIPSDIRIAAIENPTFFVSNKSRFNGNNATGIKLLKEYLKAKGDEPQDAILLFQVSPQ